MKNILLSLILFLFINPILFAANFTNYPSELKSPIETLLSFPKAQRVLSEVEKKVGRIRVRLKSFSISTQSAMWHPKSHSIILHPKKKRNEGDVIRLVLFEMHNAKNQYKFQKIDALANRGAIDKQSYIRAIEYIEYENVMETVALIDEGIRQGYYPKSAHWKVYNDFEKHYALQQRVGHSQFIGATYDKISPS
jgi:hypothetical protein